MTAATQRRNATGLARQEEILDAAYALFGAEGFSGVSLRAIAAKAGLSHAALLRYFKSKDELLLALLSRWEDANLAWFDAHADLPRPEVLLGLARRNAATPGYVPLFAALTGEAVSPAHPGHEHMKRRYEELRRRHFEIGDADGTRLTSAWDGLQVMSLYLDEVDVVDSLTDHFARVPEGRADLDAEAPDGDALVTLPGPPPGDDAGYARGREQRARIIATATGLFAGRGFTSTSLSDIATRVGTSKSSLLHHFGSKDALLAAVLSRRDDQLTYEIPAPLPPRAFLRGLVEGARSNAERPGLIELYTVLSHEATAADHPAHAYFTRRFRWALDHFTSVFAMLRDSGQLAPDRDPRREAVWFVALWDGLQVQWLYDPDEVDVAAELKAHLETVLSR
ncbi:TetR/AcrR family transcriptional regulator [Glycomyces sp. NPDC048151]|uniref:TetR/AcrR family transcriptional regulator n=1 Tax=Glycomyces sp. NPDC048151 TaxID=3364002 RepID=UPI00371842A4